MSGQSCPTGEGLLAIRIRALVGSFARMYPTMPGQRTGIAEGLIKCQLKIRCFFFAIELPCHISHTYEAFRLYVLLHELSMQISG